MMLNVGGIHGCSGNFGPIAVNCTTIAPHATERTEPIRGPVPELFPGRGVSRLCAPAVTNASCLRPRGGDRGVVVHSEVVYHYLDPARLLLSGIRVRVTSTVEGKSAT